MSLLGIDLDNTILNYDHAFAMASKEVFGSEIQPTQSDKISIKRVVIKNHGSAAWTRLQGIVYSDFLSHVSFFSGFEAFLRSWRSSGAKLPRIVSHKTRTAYDGSSPLRPAAISRLRALGIEDLFGCDLSKFLVFRETFDGKIEYIQRLKPFAFVDDLAEVGHRTSCRFYHFSCGGNCFSQTGKTCVKSWTELESYVELPGNV